MKLIKFKYAVIIVILLTIAMNIIASDEFFPVTDSNDKFVSIEQNNNMDNNNDKLSVIDKIIISAKENNILYVIVGLILGTIFFFTKRIRIRYIFLIASAAFFGFYLGACNCSVGAFIKFFYAILFDWSILIGILLLILVPLIFTLFFGRIFCGYVCPFGALQELIVIRNRLFTINVGFEKKLRYLRIVFLILIIAFIIIRKEFFFHDISPFKAIFNIHGNIIQIILAGIILILSLFIYRPFCKFACPYSLVLELAGRFSIFKLKKENSHCDACRRCLKKCLMNAIDKDNIINYGICIRCGECLECIKKDKEKHMPQINTDVHRQLKN